MHNVTYESWGRVVHHQNGGWTDIELTDKEGVPYSMGLFQIPTECIPYELRPIGSRFFFQRDAIRPDGADIAEIRDQVQKSCRVLRAAAS